MNAVCSQSAEVAAACISAITDDPAAVLMVNSVCLIRFDVSLSSRSTLLKSAVEAVHAGETPADNLNGSIDRQCRGLCFSKLVAFLLTC